MFHPDMLEQFFKFLVPLSILQSKNQINCIKIWVKYQLSWELLVIIWNKILNELYVLLLIIAETNI